jgi:hypothetical protein
MPRNHTILLLCVILLLAGLLSYGIPVFAQTTSSLQARLVFLLQQIVALQTQLAAQTNPACVFTRDLFLGAKGTDVQCLQKFLNRQHFTIAKSGPGSPDHETTVFGSLTKQALLRYQVAHHIIRTGYFGPITRNSIRQILASNIPALTSPTSTTTSPPVQLWSPPGGGGNGSSGGVGVSGGGGGSGSGSSVPGAPGAPTYTNIGSSTLTVSWVAPSGGADSYKVERATSSQVYTQIASGVAGTSYNDSGLTASVTYYYRVRGTNSAGDGVYSTASSVTTSAADAPLITGFSTTTGKRGDSVTINGTNFQNGATATFGGLNATTTSVSSTAITVTLPVHAAGMVDVTVTNPDTQSATKSGGFAYVIAYIQGDVNATSSNPTTSCVLANPVVQGDLLVIFSALSVASRQPSLIDSMGNSFASTTVYANGSAPSTEHVHLLYAVANSSAASDTLTQTFDGGYKNSILCAEYAGLSNLQAFDVATGTENIATTSVNLSAGPITTATSSELLLGFGNSVDNTGATFSAGSGYTLQLQGPTSTGYGRSLLEDRISASPGSYSATATSSVSYNWAMAIAAFSAQNQSCEMQGNCYVAPGGTGTNRGLDWNNAYADLPTTPSCGVNYYLAGGTYDYTAVAKIWTTDCPSNSPIHIYKTIAGGPGNPDQVAGWQSSYGTSQAVFSQTADPDPEKNYPTLFRICGSNYTIDGVVPLSGTPSSTATYGIVFKSANSMAFVSVGGPNCPAGNINPINTTLKHIEFNGVSPQYGYQIASGSRSSSVVTLTLATTTTRWTVGDVIDLYNASTTNFNISNAVLSSVSGNVITYAQSGANETLATTTTTYVSLAFSGSEAMYINIATSTIANLTLSDSYIHDLPGSITTLNSCNTCYIKNNYIARDRSTPGWHGNGISGSPAMSLYVANNIWEDMVGTGINPTGDYSWTNFYFYNNVSFCTAAALTNVNPASSPQCGVSSDVSDDNGALVINGSYFYGNTFANTKSNPYSGFFLGNASSYGIAENNFFFNLPTSTTFELPQGASSTEDYNTIIGYDASTTNVSALAGAHDYHQTTSTDPFISTSTKNFCLSSESIDPHLNDGVSLSSPFNLDISGATRGADGTWDRGACELYAPLASPTIYSFSATPTMVLAGGTSTLSWNVVNASSITITPGTFSTSSLAGSTTINPTSTTIYTLTATNGNGSSAAATTVSIDSVPPSIPTSVVAMATGTSTVSLSWASSTDSGGPGLAGYNIFRCAGSSCPPTARIATTTVSSTPTFNDSGLTASTTYTYAVSAYDTLGLTSATSSNASATTLYAVWSETNSGFTHSDTGTASLTLSNPLTPGSILLVGVETSYQNFGTPTDTAGNTYLDSGVGFQAGGSGLKSQLFYALNTTSTPSDVISVNSSSTYYTFIYAMEFAGESTSSPMDGSTLVNATSSGTGGGQNITVGPITTIRNSDLIVGLVNNYTGNLTTGTGFTSGPQYFGQGFEFLTQPTAGPISATWNDSTDNDNYLAIIAAFKH